MSRLHRKCILASAGMHGLLLLVLLVGPAFLMRSKKAVDMPVLEFIPDILVDEAVQGGGNPNIHSPPPQPQVRRPERQPVTQKPERQPVAKAPDPKPEPSKYTPSDQIKISNRRIDRNANKSTPSKSTESRADTSKAFAAAASSIRAAASSTTIEMPSLGAGSGPAYANYAQAIKSIYEKNWYPPEDTANDEALVKVEIVIAKDGSVVSARIISRCGDGAIDGSVEATLRRVNSVPPFPAGATDKQRTYIMGFNLKAKRAL